MSVLPTAWVSSEEVSRRIGRLRTHYADNPLVKRIDYRIDHDWSDDPAVFIDVTVERERATLEELENLAEDIRANLLRLVRTEEIGLHSYLSLVN